MYFFGDTVEKIGPRKYRITNGGFTTCVQPTPRWDLHADSVVLNVDHYTILKNAVLTVKGVPMLYLPVMYYPTKKEDRATGFLLPTYGSSTLRGQQIHNAFFWAIDRSQDATIQHEWYSKVGQGVAGEYRYNFGGGDDGNLTTHFLDQHATTYDLDDGTVQDVPASRSYDLRGGLNQALPGGFRARASVDYFSSLTVNQTYNTNVYNASTQHAQFRREHRRRRRGIHGQRHARTATNISPTRTTRACSARARRSTSRAASVRCSARRCTSR